MYVKFSYHGLSGLECCEECRLVMQRMCSDQFSSFWFHQACAVGVRLAEPCRKSSHTALCSLLKTREYLSGLLGKQHNLLKTCFLAAVRLWVPLLVLWNALFCICFLALRFPNFVSNEFKRDLIAILPQNHNSAEFSETGPTTGSGRLNSFNRWTNHVPGGIHEISARLRAKIMHSGSSATIAARIYFDGNGNEFSTIHQNETTFSIIHQQFNNIQQNSATKWNTIQQNSANIRQHSAKFSSAIQQNSSN